VSQGGAVIDDPGAVFADMPYEGTIFVRSDEHD
jgi:hypothetical protein